MQSYRGNYLTFQSILIAITTGLTITIINTKSVFIYFLLVILFLSIVFLGLYLLFAFKSLISARGNDVNFWHRLIIKSEQNYSPTERYFTLFKIHQKEKRDRNEYLREIFLEELPKAELTDDKIDLIVQKGLGHTRKVIDFGLFYLILIVWIVFIFINIIYYLNNFSLKIILEKI